MRVRGDEHAACAQQRKQPILRQALLAILASQTLVTMLQPVFVLYVEQLGVDAGRRRNEHPRSAAERLAPVSEWIRSEWQKLGGLALLMYPFALVFRAAAALRRAMYRARLLPSWRAPVPVIVVRLPEAAFTMR